jgi:hypothetical protein
MVQPVEIELSCLSNLFEYEKMSRSIDSIEDLETLRIVAKNAIKLYIAQQELLSQTPLSHFLGPEE